MIFNWEGAVQEANDPATSKVPGQVRVGLIPAQPPVVSSTTLGPEGLAIMSNAPNKEAAVKFIEYMMDPEVQKAIFVNGGFFPVYSDLYDDPELAELVDDFAIYGEQFSYGHSRPKVVQYNEISDILQLELHNALLQRKSPQQALDDAAAKIIALTKDNLQTHSSGSAVRLPRSLSDMGGWLCILPLPSGCANTVRE